MYDIQQKYIHACKSMWEISIFEIIHNFYKKFFAYFALMLQVKDFFNESIQIFIEIFYKYIMYIV